MAWRRKSTTSPNLPQPVPDGWHIQAELGRGAPTCPHGGLNGRRLTVAPGIIKSGCIPLTIHPSPDNLLGEADFDEIVEQSLPSGSLKANPKKIEPEDILELLAAVF